MDNNQINDSQNDDSQSMRNASNVGIPPSSYGVTPPPSSSINQAGNNEKTNTMAVLSLVFSFIFTVLGLVFGVIALGQIKKTGESGKGLAIAGIIISTIGIIIGAFVFGLIMLGMFSATGTDKIDDAIGDKISENSTSVSSNVSDTVQIDTFAKAGDLRVKVNSVKEFDGKEIMRPVAGSIFLNVELEIMNKGFDTKYISPTTQIYIKDSESRKYKSDILAVPDSAPSVGGELPNNETVKGLVGFELPKNAKGLKLYFEDGSLTDVNIAVIDLGR